MKEQNAQKCGPNRCISKCTNHLFQLTPLQKNLHFSRDTQVKFCPKLNKQQFVECRTLQVGESVMPEFNSDHKHYTRAFLLPVDRAQYVEQDDRIRQEHEVKVKEALYSGFSMWLPKPSRKYRFCGVCKCDYEDYIKHIKQNSHKQCIRRNKFNGYILEAADEFNNYPLKTTLSDAPTEVSRATIKKPQIIDLEGEDEVIVERLPAKRRKTQSAFIYPQQRVERHELPEQPEVQEQPQAQVHYPTLPLPVPTDSLMMKQYLWNSMMMQMMMNGHPSYPYQQMDPMLQYSMYYSQAFGEPLAMMNAAYNNI